MSQHQHNPNGNTLFGLHNKGQSAQIHYLSTFTNFDGCLDIACWGETATYKASLFPNPSLNPP